jgi:hypothetical protein
MGRGSRRKEISGVARAAGLALLVFSSAPATASAQSAAPRDASELRPAGNAAVVTCFAGCDGGAGKVIAQVNLPPPAAPREGGDIGSGWRQAGKNNWCHDKYGCRTRNAVQAPPRPVRKVQIHCFTDPKGKSVCNLY